MDKGVYSVGEPGNRAKPLSAFFTPALKAQIIELYGAKPQAQFANVSALIDNRVGVA